MTSFILGFIVGALVAVGVAGFLIYKLFLKNFRVWK